MTQITTPKDVYIVDYPEAIEFRDKQASIFWPASEIDVAKDKQCILVDMTEAERHAVMTTLKLFTKYELIIGQEIWLGRIMEWFPRPEIQSMAALFGAMELAVHTEFYSKLNQVLNLDNEEFYNEYTKDKVLSSRIKHLDTLVSGEDIPLALAAFTFMEGAILYSSFAFLKHFQSRGKNKLMNVVAGINFSARDEHLHSEASAWLFRQYCKEEGIDMAKYEKRILKIAEKVFEHERQIISKLFEKGNIKGVTDTQLEHFVQSRIDLCLRNLGYTNHYSPNYNPIKDWFYDGVNGYQMNDFFASVGNQYERGWQKEGFKW